MSIHFEIYQKYKEQLTQIRIKNKYQESQEEDDLLEKMDTEWWLLSVDERKNTESDTILLPGNPSSLDEAFQLLSKDSETKYTFMDCDEDIVLAYHHSIGREIRNNWLFRSDESLLKQYFHKQYGITHVDDISSIVLISYWRFMHNQDLKIEEQVKECLDHWKIFKNE